MRALRVTLCTGVLAVAALSPTACTAYAEDGAGVSVSPSVPVPGTDVTLRVTDCAEQRTATAVSAAFVAEARLTGADGTLVGETRVRSTLTAGTYTVRVTCGGTDRTSTINVRRQQEGTVVPDAPASPVAPVNAGGGGTARLAAADAADARETGPGMAHTVTGLLLAGAAAVAVALRSARRSRGTD